MSDNNDDNNYNNDENNNNNNKDNNKNTQPTEYQEVGFIFSFLKNLL